MSDRPAVPAGAAERRAAVARQRRWRRVARVAAVAGLWTRNALVERIMRGAFGDVVEGDGHLFHVDPADRTLGVLMRRRGVLSPPETVLYAREVRPGMTVLDLGANFGYFTLAFARAVGPAGRVIAFEPDPRNAGLLARNVRDNGYSNVRVAAQAVSRAAGTLPLYRSDYNFGDHRLGWGGPEHAERVAVEVVALDEALAGADRQLDFIKMDVQGAEAAALAGARGLIGSLPRLALATEFWAEGIRAFGDDPRAFLDQLVSLGFRISIVGELPGPALLPVEGPAALDRLAARPDTVDLFCRKGAGTATIR